MDLDTYLAHLRTDGDALADAAATAMDRPVPSCPGWVGRDVVAHTGNVHRLIGDRVARGSTGPDDVERPVVPEGAAVLDWYREGLDGLIATLGEAALWRQA